MEAGWDVVLVEPGPTGTRNAKRRGLQHIVCATMQKAGFKPGSMSAVGVFDVVEHIEDDVKFVRHLHSLLKPGGMLYLAVPAYTFLWSDTDEYGGHFRRYSRQNLNFLCRAAGFKTEFITGIFMWLILPLLFYRAIPYRMAGKSTKNMADVDNIRRDHILPAWLKRFVKKWNGWEHSRISRAAPIPFGASFLLAAKKTA